MNQKIETALRKVSIKSRFFLIFVILAFFPMFAIGLITINSSQNIVEQKVGQYCIQANRGVRTNVDALLNRMNSYTIDVLYSDQMQENVQKLIAQKKMDTFYSVEIEKILKHSSIINEKDIQTVNIIFKSDFSGEVSYNIDANQFYDINEMEKTSYDKAAKLGGKIIWTTYFPSQQASDGNHSISGGGLLASRAFHLLKNGQLIGVFNVLFSSDYFNSVYDGMISEGDVYLVDNEGNIAFSNNREKIYTKFPYMELLYKNQRQLQSYDNVLLSMENSDNMLLTCSLSKVNNWYIVYMTPYSELLKDNKKLGSMIIVISIILLLISGAVTYMFSLSIAKPLRRLKAVTNIVKSGNFDVTGDTLEGNDEITSLSADFDDMIKKLKSLIQEVYIAKINEKDFKLKALQAQINPHFLYNTLDGIRWVARKKEDYEVSNRIEILSKLFRIILDNDSNVTTIEQEKTYTEYYLFFQMQTFKDKLETFWDIDDSVLPYKTIKLLLQPIVENSIIHGMTPDNDKLILQISIRDLGETIRIRIDDNGAGTDQDRVRRIIEKGIENEKQIGLKNVNERIKSYYGDDFGLTFISEIGVGTRVEIILPKLSENRG